MEKSTGGDWGEVRKEDETYLFDYIRHLQNQVNQLTIALLTGNKDRLEYPKAVEVQPGERIPVGHLADDLLNLQNDSNNACDKGNK